MYIIQMNNVGLEITKQLQELFPDFSRAKRSYQRGNNIIKVVFAEINFRWKIIRAIRFQVKGVIHRENSYLVAILLKKLFKLNRVNIAASARIVVLI